MLLLECLECPMLNLNLQVRCFFKHLLIWIQTNRCLKSCFLYPYCIIHLFFLICFVSIYYFGKIFLDFSIRQLHLSTSLWVIWCFYLVLFHPIHGQKCTKIFVQKIGKPSLIIVLGVPNHAKMFLFRNTSTVFPSFSGNAIASTNLDT